MPFQPGQSGNPGGRPSDKPFQTALRMEAISLANGEHVKHPKGSLRAIAQALLMKASDGDVSAAREVADRLEGKPATVITGDAEQPVSFLIERGEEARQAVLDKLNRMVARVAVEAQVIEQVPDADNADQG